MAVESDTRSTCLYLQICVNTFVCVCLLTDVLLTNVFSKCVQEAVRRAGQGGCGVRRPEHVLAANRGHGAGHQVNGAPYVCAMSCTCRVGQNRIYARYMTVYMLKIPYINTVYIWFWPYIYRIYIWFWPTPCICANAFIFHNPAH